MTFSCLKAHFAYLCVSPVWEPYLLHESTHLSEDTKNWSIELFLQLHTSVKTHLLTQSKKNKQKRREPILLTSRSDGAADGSRLDIHLAVPQAEGTLLSASKIKPVQRERRHAGRAAAGQKQRSYRLLPASRPAAWPWTHRVEGGQSPASPSLDRCERRSFVIFHWGGDLDVRSEVKVKTFC